MTEPTLLPCPFCGSADVRLRKDDVAYLKPCIHFVLCRACSASGRNDDTPAEAIAAWNRRTPAADALDAAGSRITGLEAMLADAQAEVERLRDALESIPRRCNWAKRGQWCGGLDCPCKVAEKILRVTP